MGTIKRCAQCNRFFKACLKSQKYCDTCAPTIKYYKPKPVKQITCPICHKSFQTSKPNQVFCSTRCKDLYHKQCLGTIVFETVSCLNCNTPFRRTDKRILYCCPECKAEHKQAKDKGRVR
jgi:hypothetical protein